MQPVDIRPDHLELVLGILRQYVLEAEVWVFGSRAKWLARDTSDLDLCIRAGEPIGFARMGQLREAFEDSSLPYKVDVVDWATTSESFRKIIERDKVVVQGGGSLNSVSNGQDKWCSHTLSEVGEIVTGKTPSTQNTEFFGGAVPFITPSDFNGSKWIHTTARTLTESGKNSVGKSAIPPRSVLVTCIGSDMGKAALATRTSVPNQQINVVQVDKSRFDPEFIYYNLSMRKSEIRGMASGSAQPILNKSHFSRIIIKCPSLEKQKQISKTLGVLDDKIALLRETNTTLEAIAQALFKSWFVDFEPVRAKAEGREPDGIPPEIADIFPSEFEDSPLGNIPKGWRVGGLGEISRNLRVGAKPGDLTDDTAYIGLEHMPRQSIALDSWVGASKVESGKSRFTRGQILFGKLRPYFHKVGIAPIDGVCSTDILVIDATSSAWHSLCLCLFSSKALVDHATQLSNGAKMPRTNWHDLANYQITIPPVRIAQAFDDIVSSLLDRTIANVHQAKELIEVRDALLPKLMSGTLHIPTVEASS